jgi:hypothetical protein
MVYVASGRSSSRCVWKALRLGRWPTDTSEMPRVRHRCRHLASVSSSNALVLSSIIAYRGPW